MCSTEYKCVSQTDPVMKFQKFEVHWLVGPEKDMILFSINRINIKIILKYLGEMLLFMYCVRLLEQELCYPVLTKVEKRERKMYALFSKSETERDQRRFSDNVIPGCASHLHITWESIVQPHILSCWMCSAHFPVRRTDLMISRQCVLFHFCCFCLPVFLLIYCLHLACPANGSEDCSVTGQYLCRP